MQLTIRVPWLTRMRRLAIGLSVTMILIAIAMPASAAAPEGIEGDVTVINGPDDPVPVAGEVTADVTGSVDVSGAVTVDNEATDPVPVTGSVAAEVTGSVALTGPVAATQSGDWTVEVTNFPADGALAGETRRFDLSGSTPPDPANQMTVPAGTVLTDLVANGGVNCSLTVWNGVVAPDTIMYQVLLGAAVGGVPQGFHLESGFPGPVIIGMAGTEPGCFAEVFWTGYVE